METASQIRLILNANNVMQCAKNAQRPELVIVVHVQLDTTYQAKLVLPLALRMVLQYLTLTINQKVKTYVSYPVKLIIPVAYVMPIAHHAMVPVVTNVLGVMKGTSIKRKLISVLRIFAKLVSLHILIQAIMFNAQLVIQVAKTAMEHQQKIAPYVVPIQF